MQLRDRPRNAESQTAAGNISPIGPIHAEEAVEDLFQIGGGDPHPRIGHLDIQPRIDISHLETQGPACRGEFDSVVDQIEKKASQVQFVPINELRGRR